MSSRGRRGKGHAVRRRDDSKRNEFFNSVGRDDRPAGVRKSLPTKPATITSSTTAALNGAAQYFDGSFLQESRDTHVVPRQSTTASQFLGLFPQKLEFEDRVCRQLDKNTLGDKRFTSSDEAVKHCKMITTTDRRAVWRSDKTLLRRGNPFANKDANPNAGAEFKREGTIREGSNTRKYLRSEEKPVPVTTVTGMDVPDFEDGSII